jgi:hypothetical protein
MMKFCSAISLESLVLIEGTVQPVEKEVEATTIKNYEVHISKVTNGNHSEVYLTDGHSSFGQ